MTVPSFVYEHRLRICLGHFMSKVADHDRDQCLEILERARAEGAKVPPRADLLQLSLPLLQAALAGVLATAQVIVEHDAALDFLPN